MKKLLSLNSPFLSLSLAVLAPALFNWSHNWYVYPNIALGVSFFAALLLGGGLAGLAFVVYKVCLHYKRTYPLPLILIAKFLVCIFIIELICFFLQTQINAGLPQAGYFSIILLHIAGYCISFLFVLRWGFKVINIFLCSCILVFASAGIYDRAANTEDIVQADDFQCKLERKPNIYLFIQESYNSFMVQRDVYGIDTSEIEKYLDNKGFVVYNDTFSNSSFTLGSYADIFGFKSYAASAKGNDDVAMGVRLLIGGGAGNLLLKTLKENGYRTILLTRGDSYYFTVKGSNLDESDFTYDPAALLRPFLSLNQALILPKSINRKFFAISPEGSKNYSGNLFKRVKTAMRYVGKEPLFVCFKAGAAHVPSGYTLDKLTLWIKQYPEYVRGGNNKLREIVDYIVSKDPDSIIVLIGDHGAKRFYPMEMDAENISEMFSALQDNGIDLEEFVKDYFSFLLSVCRGG